MSGTSHPTLRGRAAAATEVRTGGPDVSVGLGARFLGLERAAHQRGPVEVERVPCDSRARAEPPGAGSRVRGQSTANRTLAGVQGTLPRAGHRCEPQRCHAASHPPRAARPRSCLPSCSGPGASSSSFPLPRPVCPGQHRGACVPRPGSPTRHGARRPPSRQTGRGEPDTEEELESGPKGEGPAAGPRERWSAGTFGFCETRRRSLNTELPA